MTLYECEKQLSYLKDRKIKAKFLMREAKRAERDDLVAKCKDEIFEINKEIKSINYKIYYRQKHEYKGSTLFEMFGKTKPELSKEEMREYNKIMQRRHRSEYKEY